jgi:hypothetical protein
MKRPGASRKTAIAWLAASLLAPALACAWPMVAPRFGGGRSKQQEQADRGDVPEEIVPKSRKHASELPAIRAKPDALLTQELEPRLSPFLLARPDGRTTLGFLQWTPNQGDRIFVVDLPAGGAGASTGNAAKPAPRLVNEQPSEIIRPIGVLDAQGRAWIFWTELVGELAQLRFAREDGKGGFTAPATLTGAAGSPTAGAPNLNVEAALHSDGQIYLTWESEGSPNGGGSSDGTPTATKPPRRPSKDVLVARVSEAGELAPPRVVGDGPWSDLDPVITSEGGKLWIAWVQWLERDYDVMLRSFDPASGELSPVLSVSADSQGDDLHPSLAAASNGDLWLAWDRVENSTRGESAPASLRVRRREDLLDVTVHVACVRGGKVLVPEHDGAVPNGFEMSTAGGVPRIAVDERGRPWIAYRFLEEGPGLRGHGQEGFPLALQRLDAKGWSAPSQIDESVGGSDEPTLARAGRGVLAAFQCDRRFDREARRDRLHVPPSIGVELGRRGVRIQRWYGTPGIGLASGHLDDDGIGPPEGLVEHVAARSTLHFHPFDGHLDDPIVTGEKHYEIAREVAGADGKTQRESYFVYWGDLHRHSNVSRCSHGMEPAPEDRWEWGRDIHLCDFMALTDHAGHLVPSSWWQLDKLCWLYRSPSFCTLAGWEWSTEQYGHHNVILPGRMTPLIGDDDTIEGLYKRLRPGECVTIPHHSSDVNFPNDFPTCKDEYTRLIEVYQACRGNFEYDGCYKQSVAASVLGSFVQDALEQGHKFGIIASTDHNFGQSYACVLAKSLDRASLFDALLNRRTYGATAKGLLVDLRVNGAILGEEVVCTAGPHVSLHVVGTTDLVDVVVFKNGRIWKSFGRDPDAAPATDLAPSRLVVELPARAAAPSEPWKLEVKAPKVAFEKLVDRRGFARRREAPSWSFSESAATLTWPAGFEPKPFSDEFALHARGPADALFTFQPSASASDSSAAVTATFAELRAKPLELEAPGGKCRISIEAKDAVVDLTKTLGQRELTAEWDDPELRVGDSWYYVRMIQQDGEMAWSSPLFVTRR